MGEEAAVAGGGTAVAIVGPVPLTGSDASALRQAAELDSLLARLDPWRRWDGANAAQELSGPIASYQLSLLALPRVSESDSQAAAQWVTMRDATGYTCFALLALTVVVLSLSGVLFWDERVAGITTPIVIATFVGLLGVTLGLRPVAVFSYQRQLFKRRWEQHYRQTYSRLCTTSIATCLADEAFWRAICDEANSRLGLRTLGLGPPKTPAEAVRMAAYWWPELMLSVLGDRRALVAAMITRYPGYLTAGPGLMCRDTATQFELRARAAAITDFLLDPPDLDALAE